MGDHPRDEETDDEFSLDDATVDEDEEREQREQRLDAKTNLAPTRVSFNKAGDDSFVFDAEDLDDIPDFGLESGTFKALGVEITSRDDIQVVSDRSPWAAFTGCVDAPTPFDRINQLRLVLGLLQTFMQSSSVLEKLSDDLASLGEKVGRLDSMAADAPERAELEAEVAAAFEDVDERLVDAERKVPASWLRRHFDSTEIDEATLAHYLRFLLAHLDATPECWTRIDLIVTRLTRRKIRDDYFLPREPDRLVDLFNQILPPSQTPAEVRNTAVQFFSDATDRLFDFGDVEDLFTSGFYVDLAGYKISLRLHYFDPVVLFAAAKTNIALHNWLEAQKNAGRSLDALGTQFAEAHEKIRAIFTRQGQDFEAIARFRARMLAAEEPEPEPEKEPESDWDAQSKIPPKLGRWLVFAAVVVAALVVAGSTALTVWRTHKRDLSELSASETAALHPMLTKASVGGGDPPTLLVGEIDSSQWMLLDRQQKRAEVEILMSGMRVRGITNALIYRDQEIAIHIVEGTLRVLE